MHYHQMRFLHSLAWLIRELSSFGTWIETNVRMLTRFFTQPW